VSGERSAERASAAGDWTPQCSAQNSRVADRA